MARPLSGSALRQEPALGDFAIQRLRTDADLVGDELPFAPPGSAAAVPRDPGIEPIGYRSQRENFGAQSRALKLPGEMIGPYVAELGTLREQLFEAGLRIDPGVGRAECDGVAMI